ncbi:hypothetical protein AMEX_G6703 [Astyanax mexicanus]|uniref:Uncharacterized protein n=1 Tax=Astyanax mexicanus TaxID=7994 RepID=A0A8T2M387_ASTMX|nr:hypothetical protein AMEX_G6703 [Astyanax mexicanus]
MKVGQNEIFDNQLKPLLQSQFLQHWNEDSYSQQEMQGLDTAATAPRGPGGRILGYRLSSVLLAEVGSTCGCPLALGMLGRQERC